MNVKPIITETKYPATVNNDVCIPDPTCSDDVQNNNEGGIDCCLLDTLNNNWGGCTCRHLDYCVHPGFEADGETLKPASGAAEGEICHVHSDCSGGATCDIQFDQNGDELINQADGTVLRHCGAPQCIEQGVTYNVNPLYGEFVECAGENAGDEVNKWVLHTYTHDGVTFTYYLQAETTGADTTPGGGGRRRLLGYTDLSGPTNNKGFNWNKPLTSRNGAPIFTGTRKENFHKELGNAYAHKLQHNDLVDHQDSGVHSAHWTDVSSYSTVGGDGKVAATTSNDNCRAVLPGDIQDVTDASEFAAPIKCLYEDPVGHLDNGCPRDYSQATYQTYSCDEVTHQGKQQLLCNNGAVIKAVGDKDASVRYTSPGTGPVDVLNIGAVDACDDQNADVAGIQYHDSVEKAFGISVSDNLRLNRAHNSHAHARKLRAQHIMKMGAKRLQAHVARTGVSDPYGTINYRTQEDNKRDCNHDGKQYCKFTFDDHENHYGYCSDDCSNCKIDCVTCNIVQTCETFGGSAAIPARKEDPDCEDLFLYDYTSYDACAAVECLDAGVDCPNTCVKTHECVMTDPVPAVAGEKVKADCVDGVGPYVEKSVAKDIDGNVLGRYEDITCTATDCEVNCNNDDCEDRSAVGTGANAGLCVPPANAVTCKQAGTCGVGVECDVNEHCGAGLECNIHDTTTNPTGDNKCRVPIEYGCKFHNKDGELADLNHERGVEINDLTIEQIKSEFITCGNVAEADCTTDDLVIDTTQQALIVNDEQLCTCGGLEAAAKAEGQDQTVIDEMEGRIKELENLVDDGVYADICTDDGKSHL